MPEQPELTLDFVSEDEQLVSTFDESDEWIAIKRQFDASGPPVEVDLDWAEQVTEVLCSAHPAQAREIRRVRDTVLREHPHRQQQRPPRPVKNMIIRAAPRPRRREHQPRRRAGSSPRRARAPAGRSGDDDPSPARPPLGPLRQPRAAV